MKVFNVNIAILDVKTNTFYFGFADFYRNVLMSRLVRNATLAYFCTKFTQTLHKN